MINTINIFLRVLIVLITLALFWTAGSGMAQTAPAAQAVFGSQQESVLTVHDASIAIAEELVKIGEGKDIKAHITGARDEEVVISAPQPVTAHVDALEVDKSHTHWQATLLLTSAGKNLAPVKLSGTYEEISQIPVLKHAMGVGEVISQEDIDWDAEPVSHLRKTTISSANDLIGKSPKHVISQGRAVRFDEVASPAIINKGTHITLLYKTHNLVIRTLGEAVDSGAKGDVIRVKNLASKSIIEGTVESGDSVRVTSPDATSAEAM